MADVDDILARHRPGDGVAVELRRDGRELTVQVELDRAPGLRAHRLASGHLRWTR